MILRACAVLFLGCSASLAQTPGPSCHHARRAVPRAICFDADLARADSAMTAALGAAMAKAGNDAALVQATQQRWLKYRDERCGADLLGGLGAATAATYPDWRKACLASLYRARIERLRALGNGSRLCGDLLPAVPAAGTRVATVALSDLVAQWTGNALRLADRAGDTQHLSGGLSLRSRSGEPQTCQTCALTQQTASGSIAVALPAGFETCAARLDLAEFHGTPALLAAGSSTLSMALRNGSAWSATCSLAIASIPSYAVAGEVCDGPLCGALGEVAPRLGDAMASDAARQALRSPSLLPQYEQAWREMVSLGHAEFGSSMAFVPMAAGGHLLLGKLDAAASGCCDASATDRLSVYEDVRGKLQSAGAFVLKVANRVLAYAD